MNLEKILQKTPLTGILEKIGKIMNFYINKNKKYYLLVTKKVAFPIKIRQNPAKIRLNPRIFLWISPHFDGFLQKKI